MIVIKFVELGENDEELKIISQVQINGDWTDRDIRFEIEELIYRTVLKIDNDYNLADYENLENSIEYIVYNQDTGEIHRRGDCVIYYYNL